MEKSSTMLLIFLFLLFLLAGGIGLQIFLSKRKSRWPGLVIPLICFLYSFSLVYSLHITYGATGVSKVTTTIDGVVVGEEVQPTQKENPEIIGVLAKVIPAFLIANLPTVGCLTIYSACRESHKKKLEMDKMHIQDLE